MLRSKSIETSLLPWLFPADCLFKFYSFEDLDFFQCWTKAAIAMLSINYQHHSVLRFDLRIFMFLVKSVIWLIFLSNQLQIFEVTTQFTSNSTSKTKQEEPPKTELTLNNSSSDNSTTLSQVASTLEPIYFGKYPISDPHSLTQRPQFSASFQDPQTDFYASDTHPPLGSFYYGLKDDQLRRPNFGLDGSDEQDNDIVTLQAFGGNQDGSSSPREPQSIESDSLEPLRKLDLSLLRQLPAHKQVQLVKKALMAAQTQRPTLNLVSGTMLPRGATSYTSPSSYNESSLRNLNMIGSQQQQQYLADLLSQMKSPEPQLQYLNQDLGSQDQNEESDELQPNTGALNLNLNLQQQLQHLIGGKQPSKESIISHSNNNPENDQHFLRRLVGGERAELDDNGSQNDKSSATKAIPIERLVDHLMANSRLSTFGIQHDNLLLPEDEEVLDEGEDEEEEEEPEGDEANEEAQESVLVEKKSLPTTANGFSPLLNKSSSWIPLDSILEKSSSSKNGVVRLRDTKRPKKKSESEEKLGSKSTRNNKKTKRKKRKKKRRNKRDGLGLVIGDKLLTRNDLIRLISILNKMSKKGKNAKEREASRKLLRYIIKLMLVDYKKNTLKEQVDSPPSSETKSEGRREKKTKEKGSKRIDSIRDLLRPLIEGPSDHEDREKKKEPKEKEKEKTDDDDEDNLIELRPLLSEKFDNKKKSISNDTAAEDENPKEEDKDPKESEAKLKHTGLSKLSEDLEQYFDTDFYEDMADKMDDKNKTHVGSASGTRVFRVAAKSGRRPRLVYTVPVPIYGQQLFEAADEDDTDFDAVPVSAEALSKRRHRKRRRSAKRRTPRRRRTRVDDKDEQESDEAESEEEEDEPSEPNEDELEPPAAESGEKDKGEPAESKEEVTSAQEDEQDSQAKSEQNEQELPKNDPEKIVKRQKKYSNAAKATKKRKRRRRKRRKNKDESSEIDYDSRYEIPAPIVAGRMASDTRHTGNSTKKTTQALKRNLHSIPAKKKGFTQINNSKTYANNNSTLTNKSRKSRASLSKPNRLTGKKLKPQVKHNDSVIQLDQKDQKEQAPEEDDEDYYNEGTSYSKICDDDGKCTVSVQSSSPKLERAIRSKDKTSIAKQLGPWIAKSD